MPQSQTVDQRGRGKQTITATWHLENNKNKATGSILPSKMIVKLEKDTKYCITKQGPTCNAKTTTSNGSDNKQ